MRVDYHMHTPLCRHAVGDPPHYVAAAAAAGIAEICFTCHCPMPDWFDQWPRMRRAELPEYLAIVRAAQGEKVAGARGVRVLLGLEADYFPGTEEYVREMLAAHPFDFVLGSVHIQNPNYQERLREAGALDPAAKVEFYFQELAAAAATGLFDSIAHPDLVKLLVTFDPRDHEATIRAALRAIRAAGACLEVNTSGRRRPFAETYPSATILGWAVEEELPLTFGSDSHAPDQVGHAWGETRGELLALGVTHLHRFEGRRRIPLPLQETST
jgi:histidinol-phosphatase (PHP family)